MKMRNDRAMNRVRIVCRAGVMAAGLAAVVVGLAAVGLGEHGQIGLGLSLAAAGVAFGVAGVAAWLLD